MADETVLKDGIIPDPLIRPAFTKKYLENEKKEASREIVAVSINEDERKIINELKLCLNQHQDSKIFKTALIVLQNVIHGTFGSCLMQKISDPVRRRPEIDVSKNL